MADRADVTGKVGFRSKKVLTQTLSDKKNLGGRNITWGQIKSEKKRPNGRKKNIGKTQLMQNALVKRGLFIQGFQGLVMLSAWVLQVPLSSYLSPVCGHPDARLSGPVSPVAHRRKVDHINQATGKVLREPRSQRGFLEDQKTSRPEAL